MLIILSICLFLLKLNVIECEVKISIIKNEMPLDMETQATGLVIDEVKRNQTLDSIALKLTQDFNQIYGPQWFCFIGHNSVGSHFDPQPKTLLWFSYDTTNVILFKVKQTPNMVRNNSIK